MEPPKPNTKDDLRPPFQHIGDVGWDSWLRRLLLDSGLENELPLPQPISAQAIAQRESELGVLLPTNLKTFLHTFGPLQFEHFRVLPPEEIEFFSDSNLEINLTPAQVSLCSHIITVAQVLIDEELIDFYGLHLPGGKIYCCSHFHNLFWEVLPSFDNLIKLAAVDIYRSGLFGWDDAFIDNMVEEIAHEELGLQEFEL